MQNSNLFRLFRAGSSPFWRQSLRKLETTPNSGIVYFLACQRAHFACRAIDAPLMVPYVCHWAANGMCLRGRLSVERSFICIAWRSGRSTSRSMSLATEGTQESLAEWWGWVVGVEAVFFSVFSVFSVPKLLLLQSYKIIFISPNFAWLKLAKIHQETALKLLKNIKFMATHTMPAHCAIM